MIDNTYIYKSAIILGGGFFTFEEIPFRTRILDFVYINNQVQWILDYIGLINAVIGGLAAFIVIWFAKQLLQKYCSPWFEKKPKKKKKK
jgi:hypothetical protein